MKELKINIKGMECGGCENRVETAIKKLEGIETVSADHESGDVVITSKDEINKDAILEVIDNLGYEIVK